MKAIKKLFSFLSIGIVAATVLIPATQTQQAAALSGGDFQAGRIIDDSLFFNKSSMTVAQIQAFLNSKVPTCETYHAPYLSTYYAPFTCLKDYQENPTTRENNYGLYNTNGTPKSVSGGKSAAQIIWDAAQAHSISPKVLIVMLQKEQGLVTDTWPIEPQFDKAMGYACPDTAACDTTYYGLYNQVTSAAWQLRRYVEYPNNYNFKAGVTRYVGYNPSVSCGGTSVFLQNSATAALYNYTPYQPNAAALESLYGTAPCGAYGNRNFWRYYNDWFGSTLSAVTYVQDDSSAGQYILYNDKKQALTYDGLIAWGIDKLPLTYLPRSTLDLYASASTPLTRYAQIEGTASKVFIDKAIYYDVTSDIAQSWGNFNGIQLSTIPWSVLDLAGFGGLLPMVVNTGGSQYIMESGTIHKLTSPALLRTWANPAYGSIDISDQYLQNISIGDNLYNNIVSYGDTYYLLDGVKMYSIPTKTRALLGNWQAIDVTSSTIRRYRNSGSLSYLIKGSPSTIYALDNTQKRAIPYYDVFNALRVNNTTETTLSNDAISLLPTGSAISSSFLLDSSTSKVYYANQKVIELSAGTSEQYGATNYATAVSTTFISLFDKRTREPSLFAKSSAAAGVYLIDEGKRIPITYYNVLYALGGEDNITTIPDQDLQAIPINDTAMTLRISSTSNPEIVIDKASVFTTSDNPTAIVSWKLSSVTNLSDFTYNYLVGSKKSKPLSIHIQAPNGEFCIVDQTLVCAESVPMIYAWDLQSELIHPSNSLLNYLGLKRSSRVSLFVTGKTGQVNATKVFAMVDGKLQYIDAPIKMRNLAFTGEIVKLSDTTIDYLKSMTSLNGYLFRTPDSNIWVVDGGKRRLAVNASNWTSSFNPPHEVSSGFISQFMRGDDLTKSVTSSSTTAIFGMEDGNRRAISTYLKYAQGWSPYSVITPSLLDIIPNGSDY